MITTKQIADLSGVSRSTVSAVLNGKPGVSPETRRKVLDVIRRDHLERIQTEDQPVGAPSRYLMGQFSQTVAVMILDFNNPFFSEMIDGISGVTGDEGYFTLVHCTRDSDDELRALRIHEQFLLAGVILFPLREGAAYGKMAEIIQQMAATGIPLVTIGRVPEMSTHAVDCRDQAASRLATEYVIGKGHRQIHYVGGPHISQVAHDRLRGFVDAMRAGGLKVPNAIIHHAGATLDDGYRTAMQILAQSESRPSALVCFSDLVAMGVYRAAAELGVRIPEDLSVIGFDGISLVELLNPPMTTVSNFPRKMGQEAAKMLFSLIHGKDGGKRLEKFIDPVLIERKSVRKL